MRRIDARQGGQGQSPDRLASLAAASKLLSEAGLQLEAVLNAITRLAVETIGDTCSIRVLSADGSHLERVAMYHPDETGRQLLTGFIPDRTPIDDPIVGEVFRTGEPTLIPSVDLEAMRANAGPERRTLMEGVKFMSALIVPMRSRGTVTGVMSITRYTTEVPFNEDDQHFLEDLADRAGMAIENARLYQREQDALQTRNEFISVASHELRTPLTVVKGYTRYALDIARKEGPTALVQPLEAAERELNRMTRLIGELLDVSRIEGGRLQFDAAPLDLNEAVEQAVKTARVLAADFTFHFEPHGGRLEVCGDRERLVQVVENLLANAERYSPERREAAVRTRADDGMAMVEVEDWGIGVPEEEKEEIFDTFFRGARARATTSSGLGLGLYISRTIVERHAGRIECLPKADGAIFRFLLPLHLSS